MSESSPLKIFQPEPALRVFDTAPRRFKPVRGRVYSTDPKVARIRSESGDWMVKGPDPAVVFSETAGYLLAREANIPVLDFRIACVAGSENERHFCCKKIRSRFEGDSMLSDLPKARKLISNFDDIGRTIVFDAWIANADRNMGNFLFSRSAIGTYDELTRKNKYHVIPIDFEKSHVLRGMSTIELAVPDQGGYWPTHDLGELCRGIERPHDYCNRIRAVSKTTIEEVVRRAATFAGVDDEVWLERTASALQVRRDRIDDLSAETWRE